MITQIRKRTGKTVKFQPSKISLAFRKTFEATHAKPKQGIKPLTKMVIRLLERRFPRQLITVEQVQDAVEETLIAQDYTKVAKAYILYRQEHAALRESKALTGADDDLKLPLNALRILERRYLKKDNT